MRPLTSSRSAAPRRRLTPTLPSTSRAPLSLLKVKHDQQVELRIAERRGEKYVRQPPPPQGPFAGSGNRLGSEAPSFAGTSSSSMPGSLPTAAAAAGSSSSSAPAVTPAEVKFEVDRSQPTTQLQIRLRNGDRCVLLSPFLPLCSELTPARARSMVATFNQTHTVGDIRSYINACVRSLPLSLSSCRAQLTLATPAGRTRARRRRRTCSRRRSRPRT